MGFSTIIICFFALVASIVFFGLVGAVVSYGTRPRRALLADFGFSALIKGFLFVVSIYAIWITKGKTILLLVPVLLPIASYFEKPIIADNAIDSKKFRQFILFVLAACLLYTLYYVQSFISHDDVVRYAGGDSSFYARAAYNIEVGRIENARIEFLHPEAFGPEPYHYYDLWLTAFISRLTGFNTHLVYMLVVYPFFSVLFVSGIWTYCVKYFPQRALTVICIFAGIFAGLRLFYPYFFIPGAFVFDYTPSALVKNCFTGCAILYSMFALKNRNWVGLLVIMSLFSVGYVNLAPAFALSIFLLLLLGFYQREITIRSIALAFTLVILQGVYFFYFYRSGGEGNGSLMGESINSVYFKRSLVIIFEGFLQLFILSPFILLLLLQYRKISYIRNIVTDKSLLFLIILPFAGIGCWGLLWGLGPQSVQFFYNIFVPAAAIGLSFIFLKSINSSNIIFKALGTAAIIVLIARNYKFNFHVETASKKDITTLTQFINKYNKGWFANLKGEGEFHTFFDKSTGLVMPLLWMGYFDNSYQNYSLNTVFLENDTTAKYYFFEKKALEEAPFSYFANQQKIRGVGGDLQKDFIIANKIKYLSVSPLADLDKKFNYMLQDSVRLSNGWRVFKLGY